MFSRPWNYFLTVASEAFNHASMIFLCREEISIEEFQYWFDKYPKFTHDGKKERIQLLKKLNEKGSTNDVYLAKTWLEGPKGEALETPKELVLKICIPYAEPGSFRSHRLNMITGAFYDEIRINNLIRSTNIEGVIRPLGGGQAGRIHFFRMEYLQGDTLENFMSNPTTEGEFYRRVSRMAYLANTISQLHHYQVVHMDLKPKNLFLCSHRGHSTWDKILVFDFGFSNSQLRDTVSEYGGLLTPIYSAPEQALMARNLTRAVDYFSFGVILHEYLTGEHLFPKALNIFIEDGYRITKRYLDNLKEGRRNLVTQNQELADYIDRLTTFDSNTRLQESPDLFTLSNRLGEIAKENGVTNANTGFLDEQLRRYQQLASD